VQRERLLGVALDGLEQRPLVPALRDADLHVGAAQVAEPGLQDVEVGRERRDQHLARDVVALVAHPHAGARRHPAVDLDLGVGSSPYAWARNWPTSSPVVSSSTLSTT
jgi:hypothetical protein